MTSIARGAAAMNSALRSATPSARECGGGGGGGGGRRGDPLMQPCPHPSDDARNTAFTKGHAKENSRTDDGSGLKIAVKPDRQLTSRHAPRAVVPPGDGPRLPDTRGSTSRSSYSRKGEDQDAHEGQDSTIPKPESPTNSQSARSKSYPATMSEDDTDCRFQGDKDCRSQGDKDCRSQGDKECRSEGDTDCRPPEDDRQLASPRSRGPPARRYVPSGGPGERAEPPDYPNLEQVFTHRVPGQHYHRCALLKESMPADHLEFVMSMEVYATDCIVTGYPKSGTTWLEEIVCLIYSGGDRSAVSTEPIYRRVPLIEDTRTYPLLGTTSPRLYKSHERFHNLPTAAESARPHVVHILRNPKDVAVSYFNFYRCLSELGNYKGDWPEFLAMFKAGFVVSGSWFEHIRHWWVHAKGRDNVHFVRYEDLKEDPAATIAAMATALGRPLAPDVLQSIVHHTSFEAMKVNPMTNFSNAPNIDQEVSPFLRRGQVGDWQNYFTRAQSEEFDQLCEDWFGDLPDLSFQYLPKQS